VTSLEQIVLPLAESRALAEKGVVLDTAMAYYPSGCGAYAFDDEGVTVPECQKYLGEPVPCVRAEMEDHKPVCPAPTLSELLDAIRAKVGNPLEERTIILSQDGHLEVSSCAGVRSLHGEYQIAYNDTDLLAAYTLLLEVAK